MRGLTSLLKLMDIIHGEIEGTDLEKKLLFDNLDDQEQDCVIVEEMAVDSYASGDEDEDIDNIIDKVINIYSVPEERVISAIDRGFEVMDHYEEILNESQTNLDIIKRVSEGQSVTEDELNRLRSESWTEILLDVEGYEILQKLK